MPPPLVVVVDRDPLPLQTSLALCLGVVGDAIANLLNVYKLHCDYNVNSTFGSSCKQHRMLNKDCFYNVIIIVVMLVLFIPVQLVKGRNWEVVRIIHDRLLPFF
jgi:hypothetical protein